jgi:hypothetical protein
MSRRSFGGNVPGGRCAYSAGAASDLPSCLAWIGHPGRALITGKCADIGAITMGQFRALAARAPLLRQWFGEEPDGVGRLLRSPIRNATHHAGKGSELPQTAMKRATHLFVIALLCAARLHAQNLSFVTCPIVRDTKTVPCWLAEYNRATYYSGNQGGIGTGLLSAAIEA